jgi:hypothetical protein
VNDRTYLERQQLRRESAASGYSSLRVTRATIAALSELTSLLLPHEIRGHDELVYELALEEIARRRAKLPKPKDPLQLSALEEPAAPRQLEIDA